MMNMENINEVSTICIDEINKDIVTTNSLKAGETGPVITIKSPKGKKIKIIGTIDPSLDDKNDAHTLVTRLSDEDDIAIDFMTKMIITHEKNNDNVIISKPFYCDINMISDSSFYEDPDLKKKVSCYRFKNETMWYRFKNTIVIDEEEKLVISAISPNRDIEKIKFAICADIENVQNGVSTETMDI